MTTADQIDYEHAPDGSPMDETDVAVRAYLSRMSDEKLREYDPNWTDEQLMEWDENFRSDGALMLVCTERLPGSVAARCRATRSAARSGAVASETS